MDMNINYCMFGRYLEVGKIYAIFFVFQVFVITLDPEDIKVGTKSRHLCVCMLMFAVFGLVGSLS